MRKEALLASFYIKLNSNHPRSAFRKLKEHITINTIFTFLPSPTTAATTPSYQANIFVKSFFVSHEN